VAVTVGDRVLLPEFGGAKVRCPTVKLLTKELTSIKALNLHRHLKM
jgi:hypothetical protein